MKYIVLFVIADVSFSQIVRYGQRRDAHLMSIFAVNYIIAFFVCAIMWLVKGPDIGSVPVRHALFTGAITGFLFLLHIPFVLGAFRTAGVGITTAVGRSGIIIPALVAWYIWGETMTIQRWFALALVPIAVILLRQQESSSFRLNVKSDFFLLGFLIIGSCILTMFKYTDLHLSSGEQDIYKVSLFCTAAMISIIYVVLNRISCSARNVQVGMLLGFSNAAILLFVLLGLASVPAVIFYPTSGCLSVILTVIVSRWLWKETLIGKQFVGLLFAIVIVILTNL